MTKFIHKTSLPSLYRLFFCVILGFLITYSGHLCAQGDPWHSNLETFESKYYKVYTSVKPSEARFYAQHMDTVFEEYTNRLKPLADGKKIREKMALYLFRTKKEYDHYMQRFGIPSTLTGGMYFNRSHRKGLATFVRRKGLSISETFATLQHEGFHQFVDAYIGQKMPIWANEGIAQYFEDGIVVDGEKMYLGSADGRRLREIKKAIRKNRILSFPQLLSMGSREWQKDLMTARSDARVAYAQTWSMVYYLIQADKRYRKAFFKYLELITDGTSSVKAFHKAFNTENFNNFRRAWKKHVQNMTPDPVATAESRLHFLGRALVFLRNSERDISIPDDIDDLRDMLQRIRFRVVFTVGRIQTTYNAENDALFTYTLDGEEPLEFEVLDPTKEGLPPRIRAPQLTPQPTLAWYRANGGQLMFDIRWEK